MSRFASTERIRDDAGMSMVELLIASTLLIVVGAVVGVTMNMISQISSNVTSSYKEYDQVLPALAPLSSFLQAEVEPAPATATGITPSPGFSSIGNFALTFYSNVGSLGNNVVACPSASVGCAASTAGPAKIVAEELDSRGTEVTSATTCTSATPCSFVVRRYLPTNQPTNANGLLDTCPGVTLLGTQCTYTSTFTQVVTVQGVVNNPSLVVASVPTQPIFRYGTFVTSTNLSTTIALQSDQSLSPSTPALAAQLDSIQSVSVDIRVQEPGSSNAAENQLIAYRYPRSPGSDTYPFQYQPKVG